MMRVTVVIGYLATVAFVAFYDCPILDNPGDYGYAKVHQAFRVEGRDVDDSNSIALRRPTASGDDHQLGAIVRPWDSATADDRRNVQLGECRLGSELQHTFQIHNTSSRLLCVTGVKTSCGCESAGVTAGVQIPAGHVLEVPFVVPASVAGERSSQLRIRTDSDEQALRDIGFTLSANIVAAVWVVPSSLTIPRDSQCARFEVRSSRPTLLDRYKDLSTSVGLVAVDLVDRTPKALVFHVTLSDDTVQSTAHDLVSIRFDDAETPALHVHVRVQRPVVASDNPTEAASSIGEAQNE